MCRTVGAAIILTGLWSLSSSDLKACDEVVRDAAFRAPRDVHRLCLFASEKDEQAQAIAGKLRKWLNGPAQGLNLDLVVVDIEDPEVNWDEFGVPSAPPVVPVVALIGHNKATGKNFVIDHWEPGPDAGQLAALLTSPVREQIQSEAGKSLAVVLFAPARDSDGNLRTTVEKSVAKWSSVEKLKVSVIEVDRSDPRERVLLSFAGLDSDGPDWMGLLFGKGKLMSPPLAGEEISTIAIDELFEQVSLDCSCSKPIHTLGVDIPLVWNESEDGKVVFLKELTESDASDSLVSLLPSLPSLTNHADSASGPSSPATESSQVSLPPRDDPIGSLEPESGPTLITTMLLVLGIGVAAVLAGSLLLLRK